MKLPFLPENHILPNKFIDIETRSEVDITEVGTNLYARIYYSYTFSLYKQLDFI